MGLGRARTVALVGLKGHVVDVEAAVSSGLPRITIVGLPDTSLGEARERVRAAVVSSGVRWPMERVTVNLSPAWLPKTGSGLDLAVAMAVLVADGLPAAEAVARTVFLGELALDGTVRPVRGVLPAVLAAADAGWRDVVVPRANAGEAELVGGVRVHPVAHLAELVVLLGGRAIVPAGLDGTLDAGGRPDGVRDGTGGPVPPPGTATRPGTGPEPDAEPDLTDVVGQADARHALEVAAAGAHHLYLLGAPGAGKTMLARRLPGLLPDLDDAAALEVTAVASLAGTVDPAHGLVRRPPYEDPHHTASPVSIVGGGSGIPQPGAISRAHHGVLFLDEAPEFSSRVLETLRQPLEHGEVVLHRAKGAARYPARFQLVLAATPCPCGMAVGTGAHCRCSTLERRRYLARLSGPLLDRVDVTATVRPLTRAALALADEPESSALVAARVAAARDRQRRRWAGTPWRTNAEVSGAHLRGPDGGIDPALRTLLLDAVDAGRLSMRGVDRCLRLAWTLADLAGHDRPILEDVTGALALRTGGDHA